MRKKLLKQSGDCNLGIVKRRKVILVVFVVIYLLVSTFISLFRHIDMNNAEAGKLGYEKAKEKLLGFAKFKKEKSISEYEKLDKRCLHCSIKIPWEKRKNNFCSSSCSAILHNQGRIKKHRYKECKSCGDTFPKLRKNKYCEKCIKIGEHRNPLKSIEACRTDQSRRKFLLKTLPHICSQCLLDKWNNLPIPLQMHHIDGNPNNNEPKNLCLICPNCHAQTESFGGKNRGKGRTKRYK